MVAAGGGLKLDLGRPPVALEPGHRMGAERDIRPYELQPVGTLPDSASILVDDPSWDEAKRLPKSLIRPNASGDDLRITLLAADEPTAATGKIALYFDGTSLKAKLPDGSIATLTTLGVGLYQPLDQTLTAFAAAASGADQLAYFSGVDQVSSTPFTAFGRSIVGATDAAGGRLALGLGTGALLSVPALAGAQAAVGELVRGDDPRLGGTSDPTLSALSALSVNAADQVPYSTGVETFGLAAFTAAGRAVVGAANAGAQRTALGLGSAAVLNVPNTGGAQAASNEVVRGDDPRLVTGGVYQPADATLSAIAALTVGAGDLLIYSTGADAFATAALTPQSRTLLANVSLNGWRNTLGLGTAALVNTGTGATNAILGDDARLSDARASTWGAISGTLSSQSDLNTALGGKQPLATNLTSLAGLSGVADRVPYFSGVGTLALATFTTFGRTLAALADAAAGRTALGLGGAAQLNVGTGAGTVAAGDDGRLSDARALLAGSVVPNHRGTSQAAKGSAYTLAASDSGTRIPLNHAGPHIVPNYAAGYAGFSCDLIARISCSVAGATSGSVSLAAGDILTVFEADGAWKYIKSTPTGTFT